MRNPSTAAAAGEAHAEALAGGDAHRRSDTPADGSGRSASAEQSPEFDHVLMRALFDLSSVGLQLIDVGRQISVAVNPALVRITGYTQDELLSGDPRQRFPAGWHTVREGWFRDVAQHGRFGPSEVEYLHKEGHLINLVFSGVRVTDPRQNQYLWLNIQDVTHFRAMERELRTAANEDRLTGLCNRARLLRELQQRAARAQAAAGGPDADFVVMFLDFDRFKLVNDTLGHDAGDALLRGIAQRLRDVAASRDWLAARLGGDEFVLLAPGVADEAQALREAGALLAVLERPYRIKQQEIHSSASIGIARWQPGVGDGESLLRDADIAMYEAKRRGRGTCVAFDATMRARLTRALQVERELRPALALGQMRLAWQPIVELDSGRMVAAEALLRWTHPELGAVAPAEFIPVAEEAGLILALGEWVLHAACAQWALWQRECGAEAPPVIGVNIARAQLALGPRLRDSVQAALAAAGMPAQALQLDIAERDVIAHSAVIRDAMAALAALGVSLAMDDFGTGSSSLACLRDHPFDAIKIDRSFVTGLFSDPHVLAVAHATVSVIENLGMVSIAEGLEDPAELATLQSLGCRRGQGYLFSPPVPADELPRALAAQRLRQAGEGGRGGGGGGLSP